MWYVDNGDERGDGTGARETARSRKVRELLEKTGILLIQHTDEDWSAKGWHSAWEVSDLEWHVDGLWFRCRLSKRLA